VADQVTLKVVKVSSVVSSKANPAGPKDCHGSSLPGTAVVVRLPVSVRSVYAMLIKVRCILELVNKQTLHLLRKRQLASFQTLPGTDNFC
jgi:hypothetical protein